VDRLPGSYTYFRIPLLRDGPDTTMYTIPSSDTVPFPALPISFPNLATHLQRALEESRNSPTGLRKLADMVETCYPVASEARSTYVGRGDVQG
jgi:hypothetical protein